MRGHRYFQEHTPLIRRRLRGGDAVHPPLRVGVLPICLGNATKVVELLMDHDKEYIAELLLGKRTDTQDLSGEVIAERDTAGITEEAVRS
ncbi:MAG: hypothetical protein IK132_07405, partial [Clostridia bacterium]|nr:hypothetical protein [Clostridia bacterium]